MKAATAARYLGIPLRSAGLLGIAFFSVLWWLAAIAGLPGLWLGFVLLSGLFSYSFHLLDRIAVGTTEPPVLSVEMLNPFGEWRTIALLVLSVLLIVATRAADRWLGNYGQLLAGVSCALVLPAIIGMQSVSGHLLQSVNPREWLRMMTWLRSDYVLTAAWLLLYGALAGLLLGTASSLPLLLRIALLQYGWLATFALIGGAVYERRHEAELIYPPDTELPESELDRDRQRDRQMDRIYSQWRSGAHHNAWRTLTTQLAEAQDPLAELQWVYERAAAWPDARLADRIAQERVTRLLTLGRPGDALDVTRARLATRPMFRPRSAAELLRVAQLARAAGDLPAARALLHDFVRLFPGDPLSASVDELAREVAR